MWRKLSLFDVGFGHILDHPPMVRGRDGVRVRVRFVFEPLMTTGTRVRVRI